MSTFSFNSSIPQGTDNPSTSQGQFLTNFSSISGLIAEDHIGFNTANGGFHEQVTLPANNTPGAQTGLACTIYSNPGVANNAASMLFLKNASDVFQLSVIRAWGFFTGNGSFPITPAQSYNVSTITKSGVGQYVVTLVSGAVSSNIFAVIVSGEMTSGFSIGAIVGSDAYAFGGGQGSFQINSRALTAASGTDTPLIGFAVLQI